MSCHSCQLIYNRQKSDTGHKPGLRAVLSQSGLVVQPGPHLPWDSTLSSCVPTTTTGNSSSSSLNGQAWWHHG